MYEDGTYRCGRGTGFRGFLTKEERIELLKEYKESLEKEAKGVSERIKELEKGK
ncbi:MAG: hypothetical protein ACREBH_03845 [Candidatus Micrarchaeaceae archaeon]